MAVSAPPGVPAAPDANADPAPPPGGLSETQVDRILSRETQSGRISSFATGPHSPSGVRQGRNPLDVLDQVLAALAELQKGQSLLKEQVAALAAAQGGAGAAGRAGAQRNRGASGVVAPFRR
eukprot:TRINITY_DN632_c0_g1_i1.p1 TRINITY_DN632_c0_g1~~TRINITY_DN632_c0_g1_i1.p1  ORF type:complete len:122 (+),score=9.75 TRINITY_DN632_c0_g1_i1:103-468(+)